MMTRTQHTVLEPAPGTSAARPRPRSRRRWLVPLLAVVLLAQMAVAMVTTAVQQTPTIDEPVYVATAADYLHEHRLRHNPEHPPLGKLVVAVGVALADPHVDPDFTGDQTEAGRHLLYESGNDPWRLMLWARLPVIVLTLLFGLVVFVFARDLAGPVPAVAALALYAFSPDVIAHGSLATLDVPAAGFLLTSAWLLWRARDGGARLYLPSAGAALGAALATRMSTLPAVPVLVVLAAWSVGLRRTRKALPAAAVVGITAVAVVWATYLVVDPRLRWDPRGTHVPVVHGLRGLLVRLLPLPEAYRDGMRIQFGLENQPWQGFLFGHVHSGPRWYYLPVAVVVKTPLGMLALWAAGAVVLVAVRRLRPAAPYVLVPAAVLLVSAMTGSRNLGTRYAVFLPMFLAVAAGCVPTVRWRWRQVVTWGRVVSWGLVAFVAVSSLRTFPFYLPYSNEAFGGPAKTHLRLHDSNVDWGQDLGRLAHRLHGRYAGRRVWLVYKGSGVPAYYGIRASDPRRVPPREVHGVLVVSDSAVAQARGRLAQLIRSSREVGEVGHSITIYQR
ncbi:ArnT family glycosyltransferase [Streptomyces sp. NPDC049687]|uniref:ArnT family glycosyltransferase n=1 Tax=Streptomyces sp. NPDC049687 TaxID=3365596 RepID=UPI0037A8692B